MECEVWNVKCGVESRSVECEAWSGKWKEMKGK